jgi:rhomboid protease GluP
MKTKKLKLIYLPIILTFLGFCGLYTYIHWLFLIKLELFSMTDTTVNFLLPLLLSAVPVFFVFRPRIKLLNLNTKKRCWRNFYLFVLWFALCVTTMIAQEYLEKVTGQLTPLNHIEEIDKQKLTKYYSLKDYFIDKSGVSLHMSFERSGSRGNKQINLTTYFVVPIYKSRKERSTPSAWLGITYFKEMSDSLPTEEKERRFEAFNKKTAEQFSELDLNQFVYLERVGYTSSREGFMEALKKNKKFNSTNSIVLQPKNEPFERRADSLLGGLIFVSFVSALTLFFMILIPTFNEEALKRFEGGKPVTENEFSDLFFFIKPEGNYFVTPILLFLNMAVFVVMACSGLGFMSFQGQDLIAWGANSRPLTAEGEWWRLLTSICLHGSLIHLLSNQYGLVFIGIVLEPLLGPGKYFIGYLFSGIVASCTSIWWYDAAVSVGASGAIFGLYGIFLAFLITKTFSMEFSQVFLIHTAVFVAYNLMMGFTGGIDNAAHIGGLISGLLFGLFWRVGLKREAFLYYP